MSGHFDQLKFDSFVTAIGKLKPQDHRSIGWDYLVELNGFTEQVHIRVGLQQPYRIVNFKLIIESATMGTRDLFANHMSSYNPSLLHFKSANRLCGLSVSIPVNINTVSDWCKFVDGLPHMLAYIGYNPNLSAVNAEKLGILKGLPTGGVIEGLRSNPSLANRLGLPPQNILRFLSEIYSNQGEIWYRFTNGARSVATVKLFAELSAMLHQLFMNCIDDYISLKPSDESFAGFKTQMQTLVFAADKLREIYAADESAIAPEPRETAKQCALNLYSQIAAQNNPASNFQEYAQQRIAELEVQPVPSVYRRLVF
jgi:hypothetical protein